jgi:cell division protein FtsB
MSRPRAIEARASEPPADEAVPNTADAPADDRADEQDTGGGLREAIAGRAEQLAELRSEQRFGSAARRAAILAAVICVLTLTIAGPVRTYFGQRTEMQQLKAAEQQLRAQIADLEQQKVKLADPVFIAAQARERLGFVMPGDIPYQVQLPPGATGQPPPEASPTVESSGRPWYSALWHTIADQPHGPPPAPVPPAPAGPPPAVPPPPAPPAPGG